MTRDVEGLEVVVIVFDLGPLLDGITGPGKEMLNPLQSAGNRVQSTQVLTTAGQSHINGFAGKFLLNVGTLEIASPGIDGLLYLTLGFIDFLAGGRALLSRKLAQSFRLYNLQSSPHVLFLIYLVLTPTQSLSYLMFLPLQSLSAHTSPNTLWYD